VIHGFLVASDAMYFGFKVRRVRISRGWSWLPKGGWHRGMNPWWIAEQWVQVPGDVTMAGGGHVPPTPRMVPRAFDRPWAELPSIVRDGLVDSDNDALSRKVRLVKSHGVGRGCKGRLGTGE
jgi:hypothetical protein